MERTIYKVCRADSAPFLIKINNEYLFRIVRIDFLTEENASVFLDKLPDANGVANGEFSIDQIPHPDAD